MMNIETLSKQGRERVHSGLAGIDSTKLKAMRNESLRDCFRRMNDIRYRLEPVARIHGKEFVNDAAARNVNSTWYSLESLEGGLIWITTPSAETEYSRLKPAARRKVRMIIAVGGSSDKLKEAFADSVAVIDECPSIKEAVAHAFYSDAVEAAKVVYSPACDNGLPTTVLGEEFRYAVNEL
ncbi:MAG: hypothetical protein K6F85_01545 [Bacteroidales bacterium]|nr:hypothetical protein [Bacteroidales bacterium]